jgi:phage protein D
MQDKLHRLARKRESRVFEDQTPDDIVQTIASDGGFTADANVSTVTATFHQINESDLAFLTRLAGYFGVTVRLEGDTLRVRPEEPDPEPVQLSPDDSALSVRLIADLNHQYKTTMVRGFNPAADEPVDREISALSSPPDGTTAYQTLDQLGWPGAEIAPQPFPTLAGAAAAFAQAHFDRAARRFVSGEIRCKGEPTLRSGREIELAGVSDRMAGVYQVAHCAHRFDNANGYETHIRVHRAGWPV